MFVLATVVMVWFYLCTAREVSDLTSFYSHNGKEFGVVSANMFDVDFCIFWER